MRMTLKSITSK